ncbi:MAG: M64 family metallo-endopeptidase [Bacteroidetes bacterium]|nr:M64 family metallo-endopeptidase [Bacteroidota bacterium]
MKITSFFLFLLASAALLIPGFAAAQAVITATTADSVLKGPVSFEDYFISKTLRIDYLLAGDSKSEIACFVQMKEEPFWGGPHKNLTDTFGYGTYRYAAYDSASGKLLYSRGFSTLFQEWIGTDEAKRMKRAWPMTAVLPFPKSTIRFVIEKRSFETNSFELLFDRFINPTDYFINRESIHPYKFTKIKDSGDPQNHVDVAFLAEGYSTLEMDKFLTDAKRMCDYFMSVAPYAGNSGYFNFYAIEAPSDESGVTIPGKDIYVNTNIHSSFYTFDMDRYLTTSDTKSMYDIAANVPYDLIFVLVNSKRYGGGGFYNHYGESTVDHQLSNIVALHEFGHEFAGLADEYYTSEMTYSDYYNLKFEPWEPNITTNVNFESKWKRLVKPETPVPTPREDKFKGVTGMFEGGGYLSKGIYSPVMDCRMKSNEAPAFCLACSEAIKRMILFYGEE